MNTTHVNKLYSKLTPHEQATLSFEAIVRHDEAELTTILGAVERCTYTCPHVDFMRRNTALINISLLYGLFYWRTRAKLMTAVHAGNGGTSTLKFTTELCSMNAALTEVCSHLKVNIDSIKSMAWCLNEPSFEGQVNPEPELMEIYIEAYNKLAGL